MIRLRHLHPLGFALVPVLYFASKNVDVVSAGDVAIAAAVTVAAAAVLLAAAIALARDADRGAALLSAFVIMFFTAGDTYPPLYRAGLGSVALIVTLQWLLAAVVVAGTGFVVWRGATARERVTTLLSVMSVVLVALVGARLLQPDQVSTLIQAPAAPAERAAAAPATAAAGAPDIYYIIADSYPRQDALARFHGFDNREFIGYLESRGFYVAPRSWSNYPKTYLSIASSLNMRYVNDVTQGIQSAHAGRGPARDRRPFYAMIQAPEVAHRLQRRGYRYATVLTNWGGSNASKSADVKFALSPVFQNEFFGLLFNRSLLSAFLPTLADLHRFTIEKAKAMASIEGPTFAFVHLLLPHGPLVFDADGKIIADHPLHGMLGREDFWRLKKEYVGQVQYTNRALKDIVETLLAASKTPPIIVIQGDHGSSASAFDGTRELPSALPEERLAILNAYLVPDAVRSRLYPTISPVNSFRAILSAQFGEDLPLLPDVSWFGTSADPYALTDVTARLAAAP